MMFAAVIAAALLMIAILTIRMWRSDEDERSARIPIAIAVSAVIVVAALFGSVLWIVW